MMMYEYSFKKANGDELSLAEYRGKVIMIVNTASQCGFTKQYRGLEELYQTYKDQGLVIIAVPSDDFGHQEPGSDEQIQRFCTTTFGVTFPIAKKEVITGEHAHPFYVEAKKELGFGTAPKWNFHKYLINREGKLVDYFNSTTSPDAARVKRAIEDLLG
jgi:glutathione peroxidase